MKISFTILLLSALLFNWGGILVAYVSRKNRRLKLLSGLFNLLAAILLLVCGICLIAML